MNVRAVIDQAEPQITRAEVIAAYKSILQRAPESEEVIEEHRRYGTVGAVCDVLINSVEFRDILASKIDDGGLFSIDMLGSVATDFLRRDATRWHGKALALPTWFKLDRDLRTQTLRLWSEITLRESYNPEVDEETAEIASNDPITTLGFYGSGNTAFAGGQMMAMGHIVMRSGLRPGDKMLEYGAGYAQTSLALARMGILVDTVDISRAYCGAVRENAALFGVHLRPHQGTFGLNPTGPYDVILFYESFHHCLDFIDLIPQLRGMLKPGGRVILAGEPIFDGPCKEMPYPWGIRLDWENVAVMRIRGWMELGFQRDFLLGEFGRAGFEHSFFSDPNSHWAQVHVFTLTG